MTDTVRKGLDAIGDAWQRKGVCRYVCVDMCIRMCIDIGKDMCMAIHIDMCTAMRSHAYDMCIGICA